MQGYRFYEHSSETTIKKPYFLRSSMVGLIFSPFNGQFVFFKDHPITDLQPDACSVGAGAYWQGEWCYWNFFSDLSKLSGLHINYKECLCIVLAALRWGCQLVQKTGTIREPRHPRGGKKCLQKAVRLLTLLLKSNSL